MRMIFNGIEVKDFENEIWRPITTDAVPYVRPYYYISNYGRIFSTASGRILTTVLDYDGYENVCLHTDYFKGNKARNQTCPFVHRIVLKTFNPVPNQDNLQVNHKNMIRNDNRLQNLEWVTAKENVDYGYQYGYRSGEYVKGSKNPMSKLTEDEVADIKALLLAHPRRYSYSNIGKVYGVSGNVPRSIYIEEHWGSVKPNPNLTDPDLAVRFDNIYRLDENEMRKICEYFDTHDINNKELYPTTLSLFKSCLSDLGLRCDDEFVKSKFLTLSRLLRKDNSHSTYINRFYDGLGYIYLS